MAKLNLNFENLKENYLFAEVSNRVKKYSAENPGHKIIRLGIGDVTLPLPSAAIDAVKFSIDKMSSKSTFKGYPEYEGYEFLRKSISKFYAKFGAEVAVNEIFVSDGAKSDVGNIVDIFSSDNTVLVSDPVYPVYVDSNIMSGRKIIYANANKENNFTAMPDENVKADLIYLCSPNNPTGTVYTKEQLKVWVDYAIENEAVIIFDAAYESFISDPELPRSIYLIEGAKKCAIEICSLSKTAGFTGMRCGYTVIPRELTVNSGGKKVSLYDMWYRRQSTKFNGVSYITQCAAAAMFSESGYAQCKENIKYYMENAKIMSRVFDRLKIYYTGGKNSPYIWFQCPNNMSSWDFFDYLLENCQVVGTPGSGFGVNGEGFFRLTAFGDRDNTIEAMNRIKALFAKQ